jgi:predicted small secreted protein
MKNTIKLFGIIALVAVIVFSMAACKNDDDGGGGDGSPKFSQELHGVWKRGDGITITITETTLTLSNNPPYTDVTYTLTKKTGNEYFADSGRSIIIFTPVMTNGNLEISSDYGSIRGTFIKQ